MKTYFAEIKYHVSFQAESDLEAHERFNEFSVHRDDLVLKNGLELMVHGYDAEINDVYDEVDV